DFTPAPPGGWSAMLSPEQLDALAAKIGPRAAGAQTPAGRESGTTHLSVIDAQGQTVSLTSSVESVFGTRLLADGGTGLAGGYFLNNQLTDFSSGDGPNRIQGGKRPRSSMSPLIVQERNSGAVVMSLGAPGGSAIPQYVVKVLLATLGSGLSPQAAIDLPNVVQFGTVAAFEKARFSPEVLDALRAKGHRVQELELTSGVQAVQLTRSGLLGGADPRREGSVAGE
ncbi:MAG: gamma-glutamyltransferase, partial [Inhella sp.]